MPSSSSWNQGNLHAAGQFDTFIPAFPSDGWTSEAPSRKISKPRQNKPQMSPCVPKSPRRVTKKKDPDHIPRPRNSFILFRTNYIHNFYGRNAPRPKGKGLSRLIGDTFNALPLDQRDVWNGLAKKEKEEHKLKHPNYRYHPQRQNGNKTSKKKTDIERMIEENSVTFHSTESSPDLAPASAPAPSPASLVTTRTPKDSACLPPFSSTTTIIDPQLIQRKRSLRLSSWDDSVLQRSQAQALSSSSNKDDRSNPSQGEGESSSSFSTSLPIQLIQTQQGETLRRHSSSAPLPDMRGFADYMNRSDVVYQNCFFPSACRDVAPQDHMFGSSTARSVPVDPRFEVHDSTLYTGLSVREESNDAAISLSRSHPEGSSWPDSSDGTSLQRRLPPSSTSTPSMFFSPIQQLPTISHLDVEENDGQFNQHWSELTFCSSPEPIFSTSISFPHGMEDTTALRVCTPLPPLDFPEAESLCPDVQIIQSNVKVNTSAPNAQGALNGSRRVQLNLKSSNPKPLQVVQRSHLYNPYASARPPKQQQVSNFTEDLFEDECGEFGFGIDDSESSFRVGINSDPIASLFSTEPMDPYFDFYSASSCNVFGSESQSLGFLGSLSDGIVGA